MADINGTLGDDVLNGTSANDEIRGLAGNDTLIGAAGSDTLIGGTGDDTYNIGKTDVLTEGANGGTDTVRANFSYILLKNFENLILTGSASVNGTGNALNNVITGNGTANVLDGRAGADSLFGADGNDSLLGGGGGDLLDGGTGGDTMAGGAGSDTYLVDQASDVVTENSNEGIDTVQSSVTYSLAVNVENLTLIGSSSINGNGNTANNAITGNNGKNVLNGGVGVDTLAGGGGNDTLIYDAADASVSGGAGNDILRINGAGVHLDLTAIADTVIQDVEIIQLTGSGANTLTLGRSDLLALSSSSDVLRVDGNAGDAVITSDGWNFVRNMTIGAQTYAEYTGGGATLRVDTDVDRSGIKLLVSEIGLSSLDGTDGFRLSGASASDYAGFSVSGAGDVNGDGFDDVIVGAYGADPHGTFSGASYVVFGKSGGFSASISMTSLNGTNGFKLSGAASYDYSGISVSDAGDVNGDGFDDVIVGAYLAGSGNAYNGAAYVVFGKAGGFGANINLSGLNGTNGFKLDGVTNYDYTGVSVSSAGDVNGDGFDDVVVGAKYAAPNGPDSGSSYVVFGKANGFGAIFELSNLSGVNGFRIDGVAGYDQSGYSVSGAGDVNGDGFGDLIVGAPLSGVYGAYSGAGYVVFGAASGFGATVELANLNGANGFELTGVADQDYAGTAVSAAGDVNGDGFDDVIVGATLAGTYGAYSGAAYVVFGAAGGFGANVELSALDGANGFRLFGVADGDFTGAAVSAAGDVNGDGFDDVIVGAFNASPNGTHSGASYVVYGAAGGFAASVDLSSLDGTNGFKLTGAAAYDSAGIAVSGAGDVNGDGFDDLIVGAVGASPNGAASGASYVVFGGDFTGAVTHLGTSGADTLTGTGAAETFVSSQGNDTVNGGGGADVIRAGAGNDAIFVSDTAFAAIDGGSGNDTLHLAFGGQTLDLTTLPDGTINGIETINLTGSGNNTLEVGTADLLDLSDSTNQLTVDGNAGDTVDLAGMWDDAGIAAGYHTYTLGGATIIIDTDIFVT